MTELKFFAALALFLFAASYAKADTTTGDAHSGYTYTYTGNQLNQFVSASCPAGCLIEGGFTIPNALLPNTAEELSLTWFDFSVTGLVDREWTPDSPGPGLITFDVSTNSQGIISSWVIQLGNFFSCSNPAPGDPANAVFGCGGPGGSGDVAFMQDGYAFNADPGTWGAQPTYSAPEPISLSLLLAGLGSLAILRRKAA